MIIVDNLFIAPPTSPLVTVLSTTSNEITFQVNSTYSLSNYEFALYYKLDSEIEDFEKVEVLDSQPYTIKNCACGSPYKIYAYESNEYENVTYQFFLKPI